MNNVKAGNLTQKKSSINIRTFAMIGALIAIWIIFTIITEGTFISPRNFSNLIRQMTPMAILGIGMVMVIVTGGIDLSVGAFVGFIDILAAALMAWEGWKTGEVITVLIICGFIAGLINGLLIAYAGLPAFIATLGMMLVYKGLILAIGKGISISPLNPDYCNISDNYVPSHIGYILAAVAVVVMAAIVIINNLSKKKFDITKRVALYSILIVGFVIVMNLYRGIPFPIIILVGLVIIFTFVTEKTVFGRSVYALGGNVQAARYAGIDVKKNMLFVYVLNGFLAASAGIVLSARLNCGTASAGVNMELDAIAAAVIGGASMSGGTGRVVGAILGALVMMSIDNGMSLMNLEQFYQYLAKGVVLMAAVWFDTRSKKVV